MNLLLQIYFYRQKQFCPNNHHQIIIILYKYNELSIKFFNSPRWMRPHPWMSSDLGGFRTPVNYHSNLLEFPCLDRVCPKAHIFSVQNCHSLSPASPKRLPECQSLNRPPPEFCFELLGFLSSFDACEWGFRFFIWVASWFGVSWWFGMIEWMSICSYEGFWRDSTPSSRCSFQSSNKMLSDWQIYTNSHLYYEIRFCSFLPYPQHLPCFTSFLPYTCKCHESYRLSAPPLFYWKPKAFPQQMESYIPQEYFLLKLNDADF